MKNSQTFPAIFIATAILSSFGIIAIGHLVFDKRLVFLNRMEVSGSDYRDFFRASANIVDGVSPYDTPDKRYVTTPIPAILNTVFIPIGLKKATTLFLVLVPLSIGIGFFALTSAYDFTDRDRDQILIVGLIGMLFGYPFYFLLERENIDGWVFLFLGIGLYLLQKSQNEWLSSFFFSLAIMFKIYPAIIMGPIFLYRKWRLLFRLCLWLVFWTLISSGYFSGFRNQLLGRAQGYFRFDENGSIAATVALFFVWLDASGILSSTLPISFFILTPLFGALIYSVLLSNLVYSDYKLYHQGHKLDITTLLLYLPFTVAIPQVVYHYSLIICLLLVPTLCHLWTLPTSKLGKNMLFITTIGISITQWQAIAMHNLTGNILVEAIPGLGLLMTMTGISLYKTSVALTN